MGTFTDKELKKYEKEIRKKLLPELRDELLDVITDPTPERANIVKARIRVLEKREIRFNNAKQKIIDKQRQPLPDKEGFRQFLFIIVATFAFILIEMLFSRGGFSLITNFNLGRFLGVAKFFPIVGIFGWFTYYLPFFIPLRRNQHERHLTFKFVDFPRFLHQQEFSIPSCLLLAVEFNPIDLCLPISVLRCPSHTLHRTPFLYK